MRARPGISLGFAAALVLVALTPRPARADEAEDAYREAQAAEAEMDFPRALSGYERAMTLRPSASFALRARTRAEDLRGHSEGGFVPLVTLERVRRDPLRSSDPASLDALYADVRGFPQGRVRGEALMLIAEGYARRVRQPAKAIGPAQAVVSDPSLDRTTRALALGILVDAELAVGDAGAARRVAAEHRALSPALARRMAQEGRRERLVRGVQIASAVLLSIALAGAAWLARRDGLRRLGRVLAAPVSVAVAAVIALGGAGLAHLYDESITLRPFFLLGAFVLVVDRGVAVARAALGSSPGVRVVAAISGLLAVAMAAILALAWSDPTFIESFGL